MVDFLVQATISNLVLATGLAVIAWLVQHRVHSASLSNLLWSLVLIKLVTPPLVAVPILAVPSFATEASPSVSEASLDEARVLGAGAGLGMLPETAGTEEFLWLEPLQGFDWLPHLVSIVLTIWVVGSLAMLAISSIRIIRFQKLLADNAQQSDETLSSLAAKLAKQLKVPSPEIFVTSANIAPFVWWRRGRAIIVISRQAQENLSADDLRMIILHEMAHIKRRDHLFRWLEWIALVCFWWNPVMWWARNQLRISEEMACDRCVVENVSNSRNYASSLLNMAELLADAAIRPPHVASAINSGGNLENRIKMIIAEKTWNVPQSLRWTVVAIALCVFPLSVVYAQDFEALERRLGGAVEAGELSLGDAKIMLDALRENRERTTHDRKLKLIELKNELSAAVKEGDLSAADAKQKLAKMNIELLGGEKAYYELHVAPHEAPHQKAKRIYFGRYDRDNQAERVEFDEPKKYRFEAEPRYRFEAEPRYRFEVDPRRYKAEPHKEYYRLEFDKRKPEYRSQENRERDEKKQIYLKRAKEIEKAVKERKLSKAEAGEKLVAMRNRLFSEDDKRRKPNISEAGKIEAAYLNQLKELEFAVKQEKLSKSEAKKKMEAIRKKYNFPKDPEAVLQESHEAARKVEKMNQSYMREMLKKIESGLKTGKLSKKEAEKKLIEAKEKALYNSRQSARDPELLERKKVYLEHMRNVEKSLKNQEISEKEAKEKLYKLQLKLAPPKAKKQRNEQSNKPEKESDWRLAKMFALDTAIATEKDAQHRLTEETKQKSKNDQ